MPTADVVQQLGANSARDRKRQRSFLRLEAYVQNKEAPKCTSGLDPPSPPRPEAGFSVGQTVLWFWAPWFALAPEGELPDTYKEKKRPVWFMAEITNIAGFSEKITYGGRNFERCWTYDTF